MLKSGGRQIKRTTGSLAAIFLLYLQGAFIIFYANLKPIIYNYLGLTVMKISRVYLLWISVHWQGSMAEEMVRDERRKRRKWQGENINLLKIPWETRPVHWSLSVRGKRFQKVRMIAFCKTPNIIHFSLQLSWPPHREKLLVTNNSWEVLCPCTEKKQIAALRCFEKNPKNLQCVKTLWCHRIFTRRLQLWVRECIICYNSNAKRPWSKMGVSVC